MLSHKKSLFGSELLLLSLLILLVACSSTSQPPAPAPTVHSTAQPPARLSPGNGGGAGLLGLACWAGGEAEICIRKLYGSAIRRVTHGSWPGLLPPSSPD